MDNILQYSNHCCGCGECYISCPSKAISLVPNYQGFLYPKVDEQLCSHCGICTSACSFNHFTPENHTHAEQAYYAVKHIESSIREKSRSGGMFTALSDLILAMGGSVYGCALIDNKIAVHQRAVTSEQRDLFRGSKYIPSSITNIYPLIISDLKEGRWVLFSGTSCQVNAVRDYCKKTDYSKLLLVDIVCHGVPSPVIWNDYLDYIQKKQKKRITSIDFRDKSAFGWADHRETFFFEDGSSYSDDIFKTLFYSHHALRRDCMDCPYKNLARVGDLSLADCWGISNYYSEFDDNKGVSLVLLNTEKGKLFFESAKKSIVAIPVDINKLLQPPLKENWAMPKDYIQFWHDYRSQCFTTILQKYVFHTQPISRRFLKKAKHGLRKVKQLFVGND